MAFEVRGVTPDEVDAVLSLVESAFGSDLDPVELAAWRPIVEPPRTLGAYDAGLLVGTAGAFTFDMTVPGGPVPTAGVTGVAVRATHRRQGALRHLMERQLADIRDAGREAFAALWASESAIYPRWGYGVASRRCHLVVDAHDPELLGTPPDATLREVAPAEIAGLAGPLHDARRVTTPGMISRSPARWAYRVADFPSARRGASGLRGVVAERDGDCVGYALYRIAGDWAEGRPNGTVRVLEALAADAGAHAALWRLLLGVDLTRHTTWDTAAPDDPIHVRLRDARAARLTVTDGLYLRLLDVPTALTSRAYAAPARVAIEVRDHLGYAAGRWLLDATPDGATCTATDASADLTLSVEELSAAYLGDVPLALLAAAGRVDEHTPGAVAALSTALRWHVPAWCAEIF